eukprot:10930741-Alexandrium_andersonii.AAC.1
MMVGLWTGNRMSHLKGEQQSCPFCDSSTETLLHHLWLCKAFDAVRDAAWPGWSQDWSSLPPRLALTGVGGYPVFAERPTTFWGSELTAWGEFGGWSEPPEAVSRVLAAHGMT